MRRHWIAFAALALLPLALMAVSPPAEAPATEAPATEAPSEAVEAPAETSQPADLEALEDALFLPEAEETSNHCCPPGTDAVCAAACSPNPGFAACSGNTCFCVCVIIN